MIGSGVMGERLAGGNVAIALLGNTIPTRAMLFVLIMMLGPIHGARFNPAVTVVFAASNEPSPAGAIAYVITQLLGAIMDVWVPISCPRRTCCTFHQAAVRPGVLSEWVATLGLVVTPILLTLNANRAAVAASVGLTGLPPRPLCRSSRDGRNDASNTFAGIRPSDVGTFILAQMLGAGLRALCLPLSLGTPLGK
jgi:glycerol uptake facilitator-like aquaporin